MQSPTSNPLRAVALLSGLAFVGTFVSVFYHIVNIVGGEIRVSIVNLGEPAEGVVEAAFYDDDGALLRDTTALIALDSDENKR